MFFHDRIGTRLYVFASNRIGAKAHTAGETCQMNAQSEHLADLQSMAGTTGFIIKLSGLNVRVFGGPVNVNDFTANTADTDIVVADNTTNYIYYNPTANTYASGTIEATILNNGFTIIADVVTLSGAITSINYRRSLTTELFIDPSVFQTDPTTKQLKLNPSYAIATISGTPVTDETPSGAVN